MEIIFYTESLKQPVFEFTSRCFDELGKSFEPQGRHAFYEDIEGHFEGFWCLADGNTVSGTAAVAKLDDATAELKALYVDKDLRGAGWGYKLLDTAVTYARENGFRRIVLDSISKYGSAAKLYKRYGFKEIPRYNDNEYADVFMELILQHL